MIRSASALFGLGCLVVACELKKEDEACSNAPTLAARKQDAANAAKGEYVTPLIEACPELDPPADAQLSSPGLVEAEYQGLLRGANGNFFDDGNWWLKAMPRGGVHTTPLTILGERCQPVTYEHFGYDYAFAKPAITSAPACGRYLTGVLVGHQLEDSWPAVFAVESSGLIRLAPLVSESAFAGYLRAPRGLPGSAAGASTLDRIDVELHDSDSVEFAAVVNGSTFSSALRMVLKAGPESLLSVGVDIYPRANFGDAPQLAVAALSGAFLVDGPRDFDRVTASFSAGVAFEVALDDGTLDWGDDGWVRAPGSLEPDVPASITFSKGAMSGAAAAPRMTISNIDSSVPLRFELALTNHAELGGNVVGSLVLDSSALAGSTAPIHVSYLVTAAAP